MFNKKEIAIIPIIILILAFSISIFDLKYLFVPTLIGVAIIFLANILTKKFSSYLLDMDLEINFWEIKRYGFKKHLKMKKPVPIGLFLPIIIKLISVGIINWMACLTYDVRAKVYRAAKRHGLYAFSEMSEAQIGAIGGISLGVNLILALVGYLTGFYDFAKLSLTFVLFNLIPISNLDGNKIFFGSKVLWIFLACLTLLGIVAIFFVI